MPNSIRQSPCLRRFHRQANGVALVVTLSMLAIVALLAVAFVLTARTEVKSASAYNDQVAAKSLAKMAVDRAVLEIVSQGQGFINSGGELAGGSRYNSPVARRYILNYSTNDFTRIDSCTNDVYVTNYNDVVNSPYHTNGYDFVERDYQRGRALLEPYWIAVRDDKGILRGRFAYIALGGLVDLNAIGNIAGYSSGTFTYTRPADTNFGYGYVGKYSTNPPATFPQVYTRGICVDISLQKFLEKLGYADPAHENRLIHWYKYGANPAMAPPVVPSPTDIVPGQQPGRGNNVFDHNLDGIENNPTEYKVYPVTLPGDAALASLATVQSIEITADGSYDPAYSNLAKYASVGPSADPNLVSPYVGARVNLNAMTNGNAANSSSLSNSVMQLTNVLWNFPQFTNDYTHNLADVTNKLIKIALNLIDFHTTNRYPSVFTNGVGASATVLTGVKATPYLNKVVISNVVGFLSSLATNSATKTIATSHIMRVSTLIASEVWNPYTSFPNTNMIILTNITLRATASSTATLKFFGSPTNQSTNVIGPPILNGFTASIWTNLYRTNTVASGFVTNVFVSSNESVWAANVSLTQIVGFACLVGFTNNVTNLINRIYNLPITNIINYASNSWPNLPPLTLPNTSATNVNTTNWVISLEADDPRMGLLYTNVGGSISLGAMNANCFPTGPNTYTNYPDSGDREGLASFYFKPTNTFPNVGAVVSNYYVSIGDIGYVHRGEPWATIRLQPYTNAQTSAVYPYGDGGLLDYFRTSDLIDVAGRININSDTNGPLGALQSPALFALFSGITNSAYTTADRSIDGSYGDGKITAIINDIGNYRATLTNGTMTYIGQLCAISNLITGLGGTAIPVTEDANREALIRAVANLITTWQGGGTTTVIGWGQVIKGGDTTNSNGVPGQVVAIQATYQTVGGKIQITSYQYIP